MDYWAYGLGISSNVEIPAFARSRDLTTCEIRFEMGPAPAWVQEVRSTPGEFVYSPSLPQQGDSKLTITRLLSGRFLELRYDDGTLFVMDETATRIWAEAGHGLSSDDVFVYLVGPIMGFVLRRRKKLALHASAVAIRDRAIAICGEAGSGKSTTAAALALEGNPVLCEDICLLQNSRARRYAVPSYPRISLWPDTVSHLFSSSDALPMIVKGWEKRYLALDGKLATFREGPAELAAIYLLAPRSDADNVPLIERLSSREAALALVQNTYMNYLLTKEERAAEFYAITNLVTEVECYRLTPHADPTRLAKMASLIGSHAAKVIEELESASVHAVRADVQP